MPFLLRAAPPAPPESPEQWRPQQFGRGGRPVHDPLTEPSWGGVRILARFELGRTLLVDEDGVDCTDEFAVVADAITAAALAEALILDGFLTVEPTQATAGVAITGIEAPSAGQMMTQMLAGTRRSRPSESTHRWTRTARSPSSRWIS